ncbi:MAG: TldD/PmbA family protein [Ruminococcus sp.]|nr:TldD/PmbA family protein [Ruminococcus sp.]
MYRFPKDLYADVRINENVQSNIYIKNGEVENNTSVSVTGAIVRVYDGEMWYSSVTNDLSAIQQELDDLAGLAKPNPDILNDPMVKNFEVNRAEVLIYDGENDLRKVGREQKMQLLEGLIADCVDDSIPEINSWDAFYNDTHTVKRFYSSKGAAITQDKQACAAGIYFQITVNGVTTSGGKSQRKMDLGSIKNLSQEIIAERDRTLDFARNAVDVTPGDYTCVLAPVVTAMFTHESFGHKSEADFMLNDKTLRDEWIMGKTVGNEKVSICDSGDMPNHGYTPYDDEGSKARETWLIKNGVLTGRLHDAHSAAVLGEEITGNCRAQSYQCMPMVRMTNTYMQGGSDNVEQMISEVEDGIYVYCVNYGTGQSTFTMQPSICYRIRDGKLAEPIRANVVTGSVFKTLFDIDAVGDDFELFDSYFCGKNGQTVSVSAGGPTIRVKSLTVN